MVLTVRPGEPARFGAKGRVISDDTARRLGCDAGVVFLVENEHGAPLSPMGTSGSAPTHVTLPKAPAPEGQTPR